MSPKRACLRRAVKRPRATQYELLKWPTWWVQMFAKSEKRTPDPGREVTNSNLAVAAFNLLTVEFDIDQGGDSVAFRRQALAETQSPNQLTL